MNAVDYYAIQFLQSRYYLLRAEKAFDRIVDELFAKDSDEVAVSYGQGQAKARGQAEVRAYFRMEATRVATNHGFSRNDVAATQHIQVSDDGDCATGLWLTSSARISGPAEGQNEPPYPYVRYIGLYHNQYVKQAGEWKFLSICWEPLYQFEPYQLVFENAGGLYLKKPELWPAAIAPAVEKNYTPGSEDEAAAQNLEIRNHLSGYLYSLLPECTKGKLPASLGRTDVASEALSEPPVVCLAGSPYVVLDESGASAKASWAVHTFAPADNGALIPSTGIWEAELQKNGGWSIKTTTWHITATFADVQAETCPTAVWPGA